MRSRIELRKDSPEIEENGRMDFAVDRKTIGKIDLLLSREAEKGRFRLMEHEIYAILRDAGFSTPPTFFARTAEDLLEFDSSVFPGEEVVCKLISADMTHRSEYGGVKFTEKDTDSLGRIFELFAGKAEKLGMDFEGMMIAGKLDIDDSIPHQLLLSLRQDPSFGPVVVLGLGGIGTEVYREGLKDEKGLFLRDAASASDRDSNLALLEKTFFFPIINGMTRISREKMIDCGKILGAIERFACLAEAFSASSTATVSTIEEIELNPVQVTEDGDLVVLDALIKFSKRKTSRKDPPPFKIRKLLRPESLLLIGASADRLNMGRIILKNILAGGLIKPRQISLLHNKAVEIDGCRVYKSVEQLPEKVDLVVFTIPASDRSVSLLEKLILEKKAESIIIITGGFSETSDGRHFAQRVRKAIEQARDQSGGGTVLNGPNCMGIVSRPGGYNTFFLPDYKLSLTGRFGSNIAVISQSGAWLVTMLNTLSTLINPRYMITVGNQLDLTVTDYLRNLIDDPEIDTFCLYLEGFKPDDGRRFIKICREIRKSGKKVIVYKAGRTAEGAAAAASHTAAMAADHDVFQHLLSDAGIFQAETLEEIEDAVKVLTLLKGKKITGRRVAIISDAGYECSVAADRLGSLTLAPLGEETIAGLAEELPGIVDVHNPVDATPAVTTETYGRCVRLLLNDENSDCAIVSNVASTSTQENLPPGPGHDENIENGGSHPKTLIRIFEESDKPIVVCMNEGEIYDPAVKMMEAGGIPVFRKIDRAMRAMNIFLDHGD